MARAKKKAVRGATRTRRLNTGRKAGYPIAEAVTEALRGAWSGEDTATELVEWGAAEDFEDNPIVKLSSVARLTEMRELMDSEPEREVFATALRQIIRLFRERAIDYSMSMLLDADVLSILHMLIALYHEGHGEDISVRSDVLINWLTDCFERQMEEDSRGGISVYKAKPKSFGGDGDWHLEPKVRRKVKRMKKRLSVVKLTPRQKLAKLAEKQPRRRLRLSHKWDI